jgi:glyoxylase-like metal-dependent hydrolase (beta-lactamase superfamily II)
MIARMKRTFVLGILLVVGVLSIVAAAAQQAQTKQVIDVQKVSDNYYVLTSSTPGNDATFSGGNVGVFITASGVVLVDTKLAGWGQTFLDRVKSITTRPVTTIINTHTHGDHTGNDDKFGTSVEIIAQDNTKTNMAKMDAFKGNKAVFLPKRTFKDKLSIGSGNERIDLFYFGAGHTNGDAFVYFPALRVLQTGDMFALKDGPRIDRANGGSGVQYPQTLAKAVATIKNVDTVVPGHSPLMKLQDLEEYQRYTADLLAAAQTAHNAGKTADEAAASIKLEDKYKGYKSDDVKRSVADIYDELNAR